MFNTLAEFQESLLFDDMFAVASPEFRVQSTKRRPQMESYRPSIYQVASIITVTAMHLSCKCWRWCIALILPNALTTAVSHRFEQIILQYGESMPSTSHWMQLVWSSSPLPTWSHLLVDIELHPPLLICLGLAMAISSLLVAPTMIAFRLFTRRQEKQSSAEKMKILNDFHLKRSVSRN